MRNNDILFRTDPQALRAMGDYLRQHGYHPSWNKMPGSMSGCFLHAASGIPGDVPLPSGKAQDLLAAQLGLDDASFHSDGLRRAGWGENRTGAEAAVPCYVVADQIERMLVKGQQ